MHCVAYAKTFILTVQIEIVMLIMMTNVSISLSFHKVCNGNQLLIICFPRINNLLKDIDESYVMVWVYRDQYEDIFSKS